jgi:hypothetical protein
VTRPILPPEYANLKIHALRACREHKAAFYTYACLKALAWSEPSLIVHPDVVEREFGIPRSTLYRHLDWLASPTIHAVLRYGSAGGGNIQIDFGDETNPNNEKSQKWDLPTSSTVIEDVKLINSSKEVEERPKNEINPKNGTEISKVRLPSTPLEARDHPDLSVFRAACNRMPGMPQYATVIDTIQLLRNSHPDDLVDYLKRFWLAWSGRKRTSDGRPYDPASLTWLTEWAVNDSIPAAAGNGGKSLAEQNAEVIREVAHRASAK